MKYLQIIFFQLLMMYANAQTKIEKINDLNKLVNDSAYYEGFSLSKLLNNIKPQILKVQGAPKTPSSWNDNIFVFYFIDNDTYNKMMSEKKEPIRIRVVLKEVFDWDIRERYKYNKNYWLWTTGDLIKYGNLTVLKYYIYGNDYE